jgi:tRNA dimethylallyltransferase
MSREPVVVLSGATASGKSALSMELARSFPLEIVNADSLQVYRYMDIGTAKPPPQDRREIPHHLLDVVDPDEPYDAGRYARDAEGAIAAIRAKGKFPMVVGGTGMYVRALLRGLDPLPSDPEVRKALDRRWREEGGETLHRELSAVDPETAAAVHPADRIRVVRALEIAVVSGVPASRARAAWGPGRPGRYRVLFLAPWPPREELHRRIGARTDRMFRQGLLDEVRHLLEKGYGRELKPMGALGYRHCIAHLLDGVPLAAAVDAMKRDTRRYAKRQETWLSAEEGVFRLRTDSALREAEARVRNLLS